MELVVGGLFVASLLGFVRLHTDIDSRATREQARVEHQQQEQFVRDIVGGMDREAAVRAHVGAIIRDQALGSEATYVGDRAMVAQMMRELQQEANL